MNPTIRITATAIPNAYAVEVRGRTTSRHQVTVAPEYLGELGMERAPPEKILEAAFEFLLEREPNTSILGRFDLREIEAYFPEFRATIGRRMKA